MKPPSDNPDFEVCPDPSGLGVPSTGTHWTAADIPDLSGKRALVTGGANGLGLATARQLIAHGADVTIADVNRAAGQAVVQELGAAAVYQHLDLASQKAIRDFAQTQLSRELDILVNVAGIYPPVQRIETEDGFELATAISFLGHFALTARLLPALKKAPAARVVSVSSITQAWGKLDFEDPHFRRRYLADQVYARTKLASLMFGMELHERTQAAGSSVQSLIAHPGIARTSIGQERKQQERSLRAWLEDGAQAIAMRLFGQSPEQGALPILYAATAASAQSGQFYGPHGLGQFSGYPVAVTPGKASMVAADRQRLWAWAREMTGLDLHL